MSSIYKIDNKWEGRPGGGGHKSAFSRNYLQINLASNVRNRVERKFPMIGSVLVNDFWPRIRLVKTLSGPSAAARTG